MHAHARTDRRGPTAPPSSRDGDWDSSREVLPRDGRTRGPANTHANKPTATRSPDGPADGSRTAGPGGKRAPAESPPTGESRAARQYSRVLACTRARSHVRVCSSVCVCAHHLEGHAGGRGEIVARADVDRLEDVETRFGDHRAGGLSRLAVSAVAGRRDKLLQRHACAAAAQI